MTEHDHPTEATLTGSQLMTARFLWEQAVEEFADDPGDPTESFEHFDGLLQLGRALGYDPWAWIDGDDSMVTPYERERLREYFLEAP